MYIQTRHVPFLTYFVERRRKKWHTINIALSIALFRHWDWHLTIILNTDFKTNGIFKLRKYSQIFFFLICLLLLLIYFLFFNLNTNLGIITEYSTWPKSQENPANVSNISYKTEHYHVHVTISFTWPHTILYYARPQTTAHVPDIQM